MIGIRVDTRALKVTKEKLVTRMNTRYRAIVYKMFEDLLLVSAQFSGDYTSNWRIVADTSDMPSYGMWPGKMGLDHSGKVLAIGEIHQAGDPEAVTYARDAVARVPFNYKQKIYFLNPTPLFFTGTTVTSADGVTEKLRPENLIAGGVQIQSYLYAKYRAS